MPLWFVNVPSLSKDWWHNIKPYVRYYDKRQYYSCFIIPLGFLVVIIRKWFEFGAEDACLVLHWDLITSNVDRKTCVAISLCNFKCQKRSGFPFLYMTSLPLWWSYLVRYLFFRQSWGNMSGIRINAAPLSVGSFWGRSYVRNSHLWR